MSDMSLLGLCGSLRRDSWNRKLMLAARDAFGPARFIEGDLRLPLYDGDLEDQGMPAEVQALKDQIRAADAVIIACPEYNKAPSGVLKNALDWLSRQGQPWEGKPLVIMSATAGRSGGERTQSVLRLMLVPFQPDLLNGPEVLIARPAEVFDESGKLADPRAVKALEGLMGKLRGVAEARV